jgi:hypothetical protein
MVNTITREEYFQMVAAAINGYTSNASMSNGYISSTDLSNVVSASLVGVEYGLQQAGAQIETD